MARRRRAWLSVLVVICPWLCAISPAHAQNDRLVLNGTVVDQSGAAVAGATIRLQKNDRSRPRTASTDASGAFRVNIIPSGVFELQVEHPGFLTQAIPLKIGDHPPAPLAITLRLADLRQVLTVTESANQVSTDSSENLDVIELDRKMLDDLPIFDLDYVAAMSQFLDPGSIGTSGITLVVNGMEQKNIGVSPSAIQQVKINQNPYSAEFSRPGRGRIEVITKPGSQVFHGTFNFIFRDYHLNARDAFAETRPPEQRRIFEGSLFGPLGTGKKTSFFVSFDHAEEDLQALVYAATPSGLFQANVPNPRRDTEISAGVNRQITENHLVSFRASYHDATEDNRGVGGFVLPSAGTNFQDREDELYYNDNLVISPKILNQFRLLVGHQNTPTVSINESTALVVPGSFTGGGAQGDRLLTEYHGALNDIVSWSAGKHEIHFGINVPDVSRRGLDDNTNMGGTYTFSTLADFEANRPYSLLQQQGNGHVVFVETVLGGFMQDEYKVNSHLTVSGGLRYDWQNFFHDNNNVSPRFAIAYAPGKSRKIVIRLGAGFFYDRTGPGPLFDLKRYNGVQLLQILVNNPVYPPPAGSSGLTSQPTNIARLDPTLQIPYTVQFSGGVERQLYKGATLAATYWATRGVGLFRSRDVNAPPPPNYLYRPDPAFGVYRQIESSGRLQSDALEISFRGKIGHYFNGTAQYTFGRALNNVAGNYLNGTRSTGINAFPANNYDLSGEWARADYDQRHRLNLLGSMHAARYLDFGLGFFANTGTPYTETTGTDVYNTGYANARPPGVPRNSLRGSGSASLDLRWSHEFKVQKLKKEGPMITCAVDAFNVMNHVNYVSYVGNLSSPFFGEPVASKPARRLQFTFRFEF